MKVSCNVIKDLLPLCIENLTSNDSRELVEEHLSSCSACKEEYDKLCKKNDINVNDNLQPLIKLKKMLQRKKMFTILFAVMITLACVMIAIGYLTSPQYIPYSEEVVNVIKENDNNICLRFHDEIDGYDIDKSYTEDGVDYSITIWKTVLGRRLRSEGLSNIIINPEGERVNHIYYVQNNGEEDILIYGVNNHGGQITLPRLALSMYLLLAIISIIICSLLWILLRKDKKASTVISNIELFPIAYLIGHICVKGLSTTSYSMVHDFYTILLVTIPIYCALLLGKKVLFLNNLDFYRIEK